MPIYYNPVIVFCSNTVIKLGSKKNNSLTIMKCIRCEKTPGTTISFTFNLEDETLELGPH